MIETSISRPSLLFINRSYWPDTEASGQLLTALTADLAEHFDVTVIAGSPNHVHGIADEWRRVRTHDGVVIRRAAHTRFSKNSFVGRLANLVTFTASAAITAFRVPRPDVVITETDPFFLPLLGASLKRVRGCPFVAYLQDVYPDVAVAVGKVREGWLTAVLRRLLVGACKTADRVIVVSHDMRDRCVRNGIPFDRIVVKPNWADSAVIAPHSGPNRFREQNGWTDQFIVMYSGNLGLAHALEPVLDAAEHLQNHRDILFVFIGDGAQKEGLQRQARERCLGNVLFLPYQPYSQLSESLGAGDVHLVTTNPATRGCVMPSKLYGILAAGRPVISLGDPADDVAKLVTNESIGIACDAGANDAGAHLAAAVLELKSSLIRAQLGDHARRLCVSQYDRKLCTASIGAVLQSVISPQGAEPMRTVAVDSPIQSAGVSQRHSLSDESLSR